MSLQVPGLRLVGVDHQVVRLAVALRDELPLHPGGEARAAAAAQTGVLDVRDEVVRRHGEGLAQPLVALVPAVGVQRPGLRLVPEGRQDGGEQLLGAAVSSISGAKVITPPPRLRARPGGPGRRPRSAAARRAS